MKQGNGEQAQTQLLERLLKVLPELVWLKDTNGVYLGCNQQFANLFATTIDNIVGSVDSDFLSPELAAKLSASDQKIFTGNSDTVCEPLLLPTPDAHQIHLETRKIPLRYEPEGIIQGVLGVAWKSKQQSDSELALNMREQLFHNVFNMQFHFTVVLSNAGDIVEVNALPIKMLGHKRADYIGKKLWDSPAWHNLPEWQEIIENRLEQASKQQQPIISEDKHRGEQGELRYAQCYTSAIRDDDNALIGFMVQATDITDLKVAQLAAQQQEQQYRSVYEALPLGVVQHDQLGHVIAANPAAQEIIGQTAEQLQKNSPYLNDWLEINPNNQGKALHENPVTRVLRDGKAKKQIVMTGFNPQKRTDIKILLDAIPLFNDDPSQPSGALSCFSPVLGQTPITEKSRLSTDIFDNTQEGIIITDADGMIVETNSAFCEITGYSRDEVVGNNTNPKILKSGKHDKRFYKAMWESLKENGNWSGEIWDKRKDDIIFPSWQNIFTITEPSGEITNYVAVFADITLLKKSQKKLDHLAYHDPLTDLPNRLLLQERLEQAIHYSSRHNNHFTVIFIDLDNFKHINDNFGHQQGDALLQRVASNLLDTVRQEDTVARIGGDEFVVLLEELADIEQLEVVAEKILQALQQSIVLDQRALQISASLGICLYPQDGKTPNELLQHADTAMYRAKNSGRNNYQFYSHGHNYNASMRAVLAKDLCRAISDNQLQLYFQPQIDLVSEQLIGVEVLIRWVHPTLGMIMPNNFISIAEQSGIIHTIGLWVLEQACCQTKIWLDQGIDVGKVAVNISGLQLQQGDLSKQIRKILHRCDLPAAMLELEVTEQFIMQHIDSLADQLNKLSDCGVALVIDDFGTGSSLSYLKHLPIHKLKIDQSFIRDIPRNADDRAMSRTIVALGDSLGMRVIAEGVDSEMQASYLKEEGCHEVQGYLYSKPLPCAEFESYYRARS